MSTGVVWFRSDLRIADNPAWAAATAAHDRVAGLFVIDPRLWRASGAHRRAQLAAHLNCLDERLGELGGRLHVRRGDPAGVVPSVLAEIDAEVVHWNRDVTPYAARRDARVRDALAGRVMEHDGRYVHAPGAITTAAAGVYKVFTPFWRAWTATDPAPWPEPGAADLLGDPGEGPPVAGPAPMPGGEGAALGRLEEFTERVDGYHVERDRPDLDTTSRLSADLKFGTLSPRTVAARVGEETEGRRAFVRQLAWRDFYAQLMAAFPHTAERAMRAEYDALRWRSDPDGLAAWAEGRTGYPIVDAGMRQLAAEGWMHNRVRMITASFLVKDLLIDWRAGERHFRRLLVDADIPQNIGNWQWVAGTGADAAPYFRIFNPVSQAKKFDPDGDYVRRWVPELRRLDADEIHAPWELDPGDLAAAGVALGDDYPAPIVDHAEARLITLAEYERARSVR